MVLVLNMETLKVLTIDIVSCVFDDLFGVNYLVSCVCLVGLKLKVVKN